MAIGDSATAAGYPLVPDTGADDAARVRYGAREFNRTRDFIADVKLSIPASWPLDRGGTGATTPASARTNLGIKSGIADPVGGNEGDIYFKIVV